MKKFNGCNENCFKCEYKDCLKPAGKMKMDKDIKQALKASKGRSQSPMFALELGGYGGCMPNLSRKYYK